MKRLKKMFSLIVCLCMILAIFVSAPAVLAEEEPGTALSGETASTDELYSEGDPVIPEESEVPLAAGPSDTGLNGLLLLSICVVVALFLAFVTLRNRFGRQ